jgi:5'-nucleotidase/UDP-sugar diphosphatase
MPFPSRRPLALALTAACWSASVAGAQPASPGPPLEVTIVYANDFHAAVEPMKATWLVDEPRIGGVRDFAAWVSMLRRTLPNPFVFDSGDVFTGQAVSTLSRGRALVDMFNAVGFDAACYGNHEFDYGVPSAKAYADVARFPVLSANLFYRGTDRLFARPYAIVEKNGIKVAVVGVFGVDAVPSTGRAIWDELEARDPIPLLRKLLPELRRQADLVVVLAHQGETGPMQPDAEAHPEVQRTFAADKALVEAVPGIDVFVGGHAHRGIEVPWVSPATGTIVVQTYGRGTTVGVLRLELDRITRRVLAHRGGLVRVANGVFDVPREVEETVRRWDAEVARIGGAVVATAAAPLGRDYNGESALGDLIADAMLWKSGADIAFQNAGGIRADLDAGPVTLYEVVSVFPFINTLVEASLTGRQVRAILEQSLTLKVGLMQVAGVRLRYDLAKPEGQRLISAEVGGAPLADDRVYRVATNSFLADGGDHYTTFNEAASKRDRGLLLSDLLVEYARARKTLEPPSAGRQIPASAP